MVKEFKRLVKAKEYDRALVQASQYLRRVPNNHDVLFAVGGIHYLSGRYRDAIKYFDRGLEIGEYDVEILLLKAYSHQKISQEKSAAQCCKKIMEVDPKNKRARALLEKMSMS